MLDNKFKAVHGAIMEVKPAGMFGDDTVFISVNEDYVWTPECIKELRKFLWKLQKQLEGTLI